jgi:hypothetical protein
MEGLTGADIRALKRCLELAMRERWDQLEGMRKEARPWEERALFACSCVQSETMNLKRWEVAPCDAVGESHPTVVHQASYMVEWHKAHGIVERLLELGLSPYVADPIGEIDRAGEASNDKPPAAA